MTPADPSTLPYRPCAGVMLVNATGWVFVGERIDTRDAWQMPQGGIDDGETPREAAVRELEEEVGVTADLIEVMAEHPDWITYDLPLPLVGKVWNGRYRGQRQRWFLVRFLGRDDQIDIATAHPEFQAWRWVAPEEVPDLIVPFKRSVYDAVLAGLLPHLRPR